MTASGAAPDRARAFGAELIRVHDDLRDELANVREQLATRNDGSVATSLRLHCLAFCDALARHHGAEDTVAFPALATRFPELTDVLGELARDHVLIADVLVRVRALVAGAADSAADPRAVLSELDGLTAVLESHLQWEERRLVPALDGQPWPDPAEAMFGSTTKDAT